VVAITINVLGDVTPYILSDRYPRIGVHTKIRENRSTFSKDEIGRHRHRHTEYSTYGKKVAHSKRNSCKIKFSMESLRMETGLQEEKKKSITYVFLVMCRNAKCG
jgi:hypothetical protein